MVTHELDVAARARRVIHLRDGKIERDEETKITGLTATQPV